MDTVFVLIMFFLIKGSPEPLVMHKIYSTAEHCEAAKAVAQKAAIEAGAEEGSLSCVPLKVGKFS